MGSFGHGVLPSEVPAAGLRETIMRNASHVPRPTIITATGQYVTRCGEIITIVSIAGYNAAGHYPNQVRETWDVCGRLYPNVLSVNDIMYAKD